MSRIAASTAITALLLAKSRGFVVPASKCLPQFARAMTTTTRTVEEIAVEDETSEVLSLMAAPGYRSTGREGFTARTLAESQCEQIRVVDDFLSPSVARKARDVFEGKLSRPRDGNTDRFAWDYWYVEGQYMLHRTPAEEFLGKEAFGKIAEELCRFGQERLGCASITPPWLSLYTEGCEQRWHVDGWHGPWAFVLSLTDFEARGFTGGETMIMKPHVLDYWRTCPGGVGFEETHLIDTIAPHFNRLALFDPRVPHCVRQVQGTRDPLKGRLVLHGWFSDPAPFFVGGLSEEDAAEPLNAALAEAMPALEDAGRVTGALAVRVKVSKDGAVEEVEALTDTLVAEDPQVSEEGENTTRSGVLLALDEALRRARFPKSRSGAPTLITVPFLFD